MVEPVKCTKSENHMNSTWRERGSGKAGSRLVQYLDSCHGSHRHGQPKMPSMTCRCGYFDYGLSTL